MLTEKNTIIEQLRTMRKIITDECNRAEQCEECAHYKIDGLCIMCKLNNITYDIQQVIEKE